MKLSPQQRTLLKSMLLSRATHADESKVKHAAEQLRVMASKIEVPTYQPDLFDAADMMMNTREFIKNCACSDSERAVLSGAVQVLGELVNKATTVEAA